MVPVSLGAADVVVVAGGARFAAHAALLVAHSGYFRAAIAEREAPRAEVLYVPNVSAQQFWPLLAYMYTGYLELTPDNIYQVLLATHLLHMPRALELCRGFLAAGRAAPRPPPPPTLIKPIPSRKLPPFLSANVFRPAIGESAFDFRSTRTEVPFSTAAEAPFQRQRFPPLKAPSPGSPDRENSDPARAANDAAVSEDVVRRAFPSTSKKDADNTEAKSGDRVVVDVACCDGPVRFHRVLNDAYKKGDSDEAAELSDSEDSYVEVEEDTRSTFERRAKAANDEDDAEPDGEEGDSSARQTLFTCVYCNHAFKSQYCYQKHARRHINPVSIDAVAQDGQEAASRRKRPVPAKSSPRREVRLLDMNVQYYPCKTCGSKFPSYYFVHKHRKLCHADEVDGPSEVKSGSGVKKKSTESRESDGRDDDKPAENA